MQHETSAAPTQIFDRALLARRHARAEKLGPEDFLLARIAEDMTERLSAVMREFTSGVDIATPGAHLARRLAERMPPLARADFAAGESLGLAPQAHDLALSALALHFVNDLPGALAQIRRALKPDGLFLAAILGGETLTELRQAFALAESEIEGGISPRVAPFADVRELGALLQRAGFALPVADCDRIIVRYGSPLNLMHDLRKMGATNILHERRRAPLRRATLLRMMEIYAARFADADGKIRATFDVVWLTGWSPHDSQQQPLRPGSAKMSLADALKARE
jgi:SAM-dependent methyltransferase